MGGNFGFVIPFRDKENKLTLFGKNKPSDKSLKLITNNRMSWALTFSHALMLIQLYQ